MTDLITGLNALFTMFWTQLTAFATWLTSSTLGIVFLSTIIISIIGYFIGIIFNLFSKD